MARPGPVGLGGLRGWWRSPAPAFPRGWPRALWRVCAGGYGDQVSGQSGRDAVAVISAAQLESTSPADRQAHFDTAVVSDLSRVRPAFLARVCARLERRVATQDPSRFV